eukprot:scaffold1112_cov116-Isochrysis_galbana.AAC.23
MVSTEEAGDVFALCCGHRTAAIAVSLVVLLALDRGDRAVVPDALEALLAGLAELVAVACVELGALVRALERTSCFRPGGPSGRRFRSGWLRNG